MCRKLYFRSIVRVEPHLCNIFKCSDSDLNFSISKTTTLFFKKGETKRGHKPNNCEIATDSHRECDRRMALEFYKKKNVKCAGRIFVADENHRYCIDLVMVLDATIENCYQKCFVSAVNAHVTLCWFVQLNHSIDFG